MIIQKKIPVLYQQSSFPNVLPVVSGGLLHYKSTDITNVAGKASVLTELFNGVNHAIQGTDSKRPSVVDNDLNGNPALLFDGITQRMLSTSAVVSAQPNTLYLVVKHITNVINKSFTGSLSPLNALPYIDAQGYRIYAGDFSLPALVELNKALAFCITENGANSKVKKNSYETVANSGGTNGFNNTVIIGSQVDGDAQCANFKFYEYILYSGVHDDATKALFFNYFNREYAQPFTVANQFDGIMDNSVIYSNDSGYDTRNAYSEFSFNTSSELIVIKARPSASATYIHVYENDVYLKSVYFNSWFDYEVTLSAGTKKVTLINDLNAAPAGTIIGCFLTSVKSQVFTKVNAGTVVDKVVFLGDSIATGGGATYPERDGFARLFKYESSKVVAHHSWGYAQLADFASNSTKINTAVAHIQSLFANVTGRKILVTQPGINDINIGGLSAANYQTYYGNLLDAIHFDDATIEIFCLSIIEKSVEDATSIAYRSALVTVCAARAYTTYINGLPICTYPTDYNDTVHPKTTGHKKIKDALYAVIFP